MIYARNIYPTREIYTPCGKYIPHAGNIYPCFGQTNGRGPDGCFYLIITIWLAENPRARNVQLEVTMVNKEQGARGSRN